MERGGEGESRGSRLKDPVMVDTPLSIPTGSEEIEEIEEQGSTHQQQLVLDIIAIQKNCRHKTRAIGGKGRGGYGEGVGYGERRGGMNLPWTGCSGGDVLHPP